MSPFPGSFKTPFCRWIFCSALHNNNSEEKINSDQKKLSLTAVYFITAAGMALSMHCIRTFN
jgi:hypothetical protein